MLTEKTQKIKVKILFASDYVWNDLQIFGIEDNAKWAVTEGSCQCVYPSWLYCA